MKVELSEQDLRLINLALFCMKSTLVRDMQLLSAQGLNVSYETEAINDLINLRHRLLEVKS